MKKQDYCYDIPLLDSLQCHLRSETIHDHTFFNHHNNIFNVYKTYDSQFQKWLSWCRMRGIDPISCRVGEVVNFLADLFNQGYQYRSLNAYRSTISSVHDKVDGCEVGQHPLVARLLKGDFHQRPPQPRYNQTWGVDWSQDTSGRKVKYFFVAPRPDPQTCNADGANKTQGQQTLQNSALITDVIPRGGDFLTNGVGKTIEAS